MAVIFVERFAENRGIVANSAARGATVAESGTQRHLGSAEFVRVGIPWGLGSGPLSDGLCSGSEERAGGVGVAVPTPIASDAPLRTRPSAPHRMCTPRARVRASERRANERTNGSLVRLRVGPARLVRLRVGPARASDAAWSIEGRTHERASERVASDGANMNPHRGARACRPHPKAGQAASVRSLDRSRGRASFARTSACALRD